MSYQSECKWASNNETAAAHQTQLRALSLAQAADHLPEDKRQGLETRLATYQAALAAPPASKQ